MNTSIKKLKLATSNNIDGATPLIINSPTANEIKLPTNNSWVLQDYEQLFGTKKFHKEIELANLYGLLILQIVFVLILNMKN